MTTQDPPGWTFLSNQAHVLIYITQFPDARIRDIALAVGVTERFAQRLIADLVAAGYVLSQREGRRNTYSVNADLHFRHPLEQSAEIRRLIDIFAPN